MMKSSFPHFVNSCLKAFGFLKLRYGFSSPDIQQMGRECFVVYQKQNRWVSVSYEPGCIPIVELFHPAHEMKCRRIPHLKSSVADPRRFLDTDENMQRIILQSLAASLENIECEFLTAA